MQKKKLFVQRNGLKPQQKKHSYLKLFLWAALALIVLVILVPFATHQKSEDSGAKRPVSAKGVVVKEIPKPESYTGGRSEPGPGGPDEMAPGREPAGSAIPDFKNFPRSQGGATEGAPPEQSAAMNAGAKSGEEQTLAPQTGVPSQGATGQPVSGSPVKMNPMPSSKGDIGSQKGEMPVQEKPSVASLAPVGPKVNEGTSVPAGSEVGKPGTSGADAGKATVSASPGAEKKSSVRAGTKMRYVIQVGAFKEKENAEELKQSLTKRGYDVAIQSIVHAKLGPIFVVRLQPVGEIGKANTLMTQIEHEEKVKPVLIKIGAEE